MCLEELKQPAELDMGGLLGDEHTEIQNERERLKIKRLKKEED